MNPVLALIITNIIWGAAPPIFKFALGSIPIFTLVFLRFFFASFFFLPFIVGFNFRFITRHDWLRIVGAALFGISLHISFFFFGLQRTESIDAPIILSSGPVVMYLFSVFLFHEKPKLRVAGGLFLSFVGVLIIIFSPLIFGDQGGSHSDTLGNMYMAFSMITGVIGTLILKDTLKRIHPFVVTYISFIIAAITFLPFMMLELRSWHYSMLDFSGIVGLIFGIFLCSAVAYFLYYYGLSKISVQDVGVFSYMDPVVSVIIAAPLLHEYPDIFFSVGAIFVFCGIYIAERRVHWHPLDRLLVFKKFFFREPDPVVSTPPVKY